MFDILGDIVEGAINTVDDFIQDPIGKTIDTVARPVRDGLDVIDGLTEGELRLAAATRLGVDVASGMALSELIEWYQNL